MVPPIKEILPICAFKDNYIWAMTFTDSQNVVVVDPGDAEPVLKWLSEHSYYLTHILLTHHHSDHIGGVAELVKHTRAKVFAAFADKKNILDADEWLHDGNEIIVENLVVKIFAIPGHTTGHIAYYFLESHILFCGDTLFSLGCGRLFEGTPLQMWHSLLKLRALPDETRIYCGHEYTEKNCLFALSLEKDSPSLKQKLYSIQKLREKNKPTLPSLMSEEKSLNPFLRADDPIFLKNINRENLLPVAVFKELRELKDKF